MQPNDSTDLCLFARPTVRPAAPRSRVLRTRSGFTLLEVMIATAVTLLMMVALAQIFKVIGDSMKQGRAALELNNNLRSVVYRIRGDLENLTAVPHPPSNPAAGMGYLKVFDGGLTDYSVTINDPTQSRYGDVDDILMGTARAGDVWYTGKVPLFVLKKTTPDLTTDNDGNGLADDLESVVIAAQHAEIAIYCQPVVANSKASFSYDNPSRDPGYLVESPGFFKDDNGDGFPDEFRLHYRALLIRPDLNMDTGLLPANNPIFIAAPQSPTLPTGTQFDAPTPLCDMASIHGRCDLSMRRVFNPSDGLTDATRGPRDYIAANSLQDLVDPANRFAHVQIPIPGTASTTMPVLALGPKLTVGNITNADPDGNWGTSNFKVGTGFLHPAFTLHGARAGEDILAANILAFDIKVYDPGVPLLATSNLDVLSPNDPGYRDLVGAAPVATGEYVDLGWARKLATHGATQTAMAAGTNIWSPMSGYSQTNFASNGALAGHTDAILKSGSVLYAGSNPLVMQPAYDTWTTRYEGDGILQSYRNGFSGLVRISGATTLYGMGAGDTSSALPAWRRTNIDAGTDGIDNGMSLAGVDDLSELETSPPYPTPLRGLRISIRMEDPATRLVKQMSVAKEFVTQ